MPNTRNAEIKNQMIRMQEESCCSTHANYWIKHYTSMSTLLDNRNVMTD